MAHGELTTLIQVDHGDPSDGLGLLLDPAVKDLEEAVTAYLRRATETFDLSKNVEVCTILCFLIAIAVTVMFALLVEKLNRSSLVFVNKDNEVVLLQVVNTGNLIGCNKEGFYSLMLSMNYKKSKEVDTYFYTGETKRKNKFIKINKNENVN